MMHPVHRRVRRDLRALAGIDPDVAAALDAHGYPPPRQRDPGLASLLRAIVGQQVSSAAANGIWARVTAALDPEDAAALAACGEERLRALGLSRQKALYMRGIAGAVACGALDFARLAAAAEEDAIAELTAIKGIGRWTAEVYLLFALGRRDVFPAGDLALQVALQRLKRLRRRPDAARAGRLAAAWAPYRGAAAHFLWHYYAALRRAGAGLPV